MMKRVLVILVLLIFSGYLKGKNVSLNDAMRVALNWINSTGVSHYSNDDITGYIAFPSEELPQIYIINFTPTGWVMVSGSEFSSPVLGYSTASVFDHENIPIQLNEWLVSIGNEVEQNANDGHVSLEIKQSWEKFSDPDYGPVFLKSAAVAVGPLLTSKWNQGKYYNELAPVDVLSTTGNGHVWTGCVATALAQLMKYWEYPSAGMGYNSYNHPKYGNISANFGQTSYQWSAMPDAPNGFFSEVQKINYHAAVSVNMSFSPYASGAFLEDARDALFNYFRYNTTAFYAHKYEWDSEDEWKTYIRSEIDKGRPVIYAGYNAAGNSGHAFICDGYQNDFFHFNWGWGGAADGYYLLSALNPTGLNYTFKQSAITGIEPVQVQVLPSPFSEGFENGSEGLFSTFGNVVVASEQSHSGNNSLRLSASGFSSYSKNSASMAFTVPSNGKLSFWVKRSTPVVSLRNSQKALIMPLHGETVLAQLFSGSFNDNEWVNYTYNLSGLAGQTVRLLFVQQNYDYIREQWMYVDNVAITQTGQNLPPIEPSNPIPLIKEQSVAHSPLLKWSGGDLDGGNVSYSVYLGKTNNPPLVATVQNNFYQSGNLDHSTTYYWKVTANDGQLHTQGSLWQFTTMGIPPDIQTCSVLSLGSGSIEACGNISTDNGAIVLSKGFCWSEKKMPTINDQHVFSNDQSYQFSAVIEGLKPYTTYYIRAFVNSNEGLAYGNEIEIKTKPGLPVVEYRSVINTFRTKATLSGLVSSVNDESFSKRGVAWSVSQGFDPLAAQYASEEGVWENEDLFEVNVEGLPGPGKVFFRLFAENSAGIAFSDEHSLELFNNRPTIDLDADNSTGFPEINFYGLVFEQQAGGVLSDTDIEIKDVDGDVVQSVQFRLLNVNYGSNEYLHFAGNDERISVTGQYSHHLVLNNQSVNSNSEWEQIVRQVEYMIDVDAPDTTQKVEVEVWVTDGFNESDKALAVLAVVPVNDPPVCMQLPTVQGIFTIGQTVSVTKGVWEDLLDNCSGEIQYSYIWQLRANGEIIDIDGVYESVLAVNADFCGHEIRVVERVVDSYCGGENMATAQVESIWYKVVKAQQNLVFDPVPVQKFSIEPLQMNAHATSGLPITYTTNSVDIVSIENELLYFLSLGRSIILAQQPGNECYWPSETKYNIVSVEKGTQKLIANIPPVIKWSDQPFELDIIASSGLQPEVKSSDEGIVQINGLSMILKGKGQVQLLIDQPGNQFFDPAQQIIVDISIERTAQKVDLITSKNLIFDMDKVAFQVINVSGLDVEVSSGSPDLIVIDDHHIHIIGTGEAKLKLFNEGDSYWEVLDTTITLMINKAQQSISFDPLPDLVYYDKPIFIEATATSGLPVMFSSSDTSIVQIKDNILIVNAAGEVVVTAGQEGDRNWEKATPVVNLLKIHKATQELFTSLPDTLLVGDTYPLDDFLSSRNLKPDLVASSDETVVRIGTDSIFVLRKGETIINVTQLGDQNHHPAQKSFKFTVDETVGFNTSFVPRYHIYPNPVRQQLNVDFHDENQTPIFMVIYNQTGQEVMRIDRPVKNNSVEMGTYRRGVYFMHIYWRNQTLVEKLLFID